MRTGKIEAFSKFAYFLPVPSGGSVPGNEEFPGHYHESIPLTFLCT